MLVISQQKSHILPQSIKENNSSPMNEPDLLNSPKIFIFYKVLGQNEVINTCLYHIKMTLLKKNLVKVRFLNNKKKTQNFKV